MPDEKFTTCFSCMDGEIYPLVIEWIRANYDVDHVNLVTDISFSGDGADAKVLCEIIRQYRCLTRHQNRAGEVFLAGYAGDISAAGTEADRKKRLKDLMGKVRDFLPDELIIGLWVSKSLDIEKITDGMR
ncbi:MAG: hypothetical protein GF408_02945 [Candidatus Omnitrophica bacterium]|nr:hypothetical protein [Candidatus Omnitrophota bacterium]